MHFLKPLKQVTISVNFLFKNVILKIVRKIWKNSNVFRQINDFIEYKKERLYVFIIQIIFYQIVNNFSTLLEKVQKRTVLHKRPPLDI